MDQFDIKLWKVEKPSSLLPIQFLGVLKVGEILMV